MLLAWFVGVMFFQCKYTAISYVFESMGKPSREPYRMFCCDTDNTWLAVCFIRRVAVGASCVGSLRIDHINRKTANMILVCSCISRVQSRALGLEETAEPDGYTSIMQGCHIVVIVRRVCARWPLLGLSEPGGYPITVSSGNRGSAAKKALL